MIQVVSLGSVGDTGNTVTHGVDLARSPAANTLVLAAVVGSATAPNAQEPTGVVSDTLTFVKVSGVSFNDAASPLGNLTLWRCMSPTPDGSRVTATFPAAGTGGALIVWEVSGVSTSGVSGANAVGQSATTQRDPTAPGTAIIGPSAASTSNAWAGFCAGGNATTDQTMLLNWTMVDQVNYLTPSIRFASGWTTLSSGVSSNFTSTAADAGAAGIIVELVADTFAEVGVSAGTWMSAAQGKPHRSFTPRVRGDLWVQSGAVRSSITPYLDTWEGEAT